MSYLPKEKLLEAARYRCSIRNYDPTKKISDDDFKAILELGRLSPSSVGTEPWKFIVVQDKNLREQLKPMAWGMKSQLDDASHLVFIIAHKKMDYTHPFFRNKMQSLGLSGDALERKLGHYKSFQENDIEILENDRTLFDWAAKQCYIALGNMMNGAALLGIDSCPIEGMNYQAVNNLLVNANLFDPNEYGVAVAVTFGYRSDVPPREKSRKPMEDLVIWS